MDFLLICLVAFLGSCLTLFSGFGLGTLLLPTFALFFPLELSIALTAIVHFLNNIFKLFLLGKHANKIILLKFGLPSIVFSFVGAFLLSRISAATPLFSYQLSSFSLDVLPVKLIIGIVLIFFALFEIIPRLSKLQFDIKYIWLGGILSGFFGGLSGNQGALRSAFLIRANLSKEKFIATGVVIACMIDISRLSVYAPNIVQQNATIDIKLMSAAVLSAFAGAFLGKKLIKKVTLQFFQIVVAIALLVFGVFLIMGVV